ncbi:MAG: hypothetical protein SGPRY_009954, partial [Prymnesium sp.]
FDAATPQALQLQLHSSPCASELIALHAAEADRFDLFHLSAFWGRLGKLAKESESQREWLREQSPSLAAARDHTLRALSHFERTAPPPLSPSRRPSGEGVGSEEGEEGGEGGEGEGVQGDERGGEDCTNRVLMQDAAQPLASIAHGLALARVGTAAPWDALWEALERAVFSSLERGEMGPRSLTVAWGFIRSGWRSPPLLEALALALPPHAAQLTGVELAVIARAFAIARYRSPPLFRSIAVHASGKLTELTPNQLVKLAWAFTSTAEPSPDLFREIGAVSRGQLHLFEPQDLTKLIWSFGKAGYSDASLFRAFAASVSERMGELDPVGLTNIAKAFVRVSHDAPALFAALSAELLPRVDEFSFGQLANIAWSFTKAHPSPTLLHALYAEAGRKLGRDDFRLVEATILMKACGTSGEFSSSLLSSVGRRLVESGELHEAKARELVLITWAFATLNQPCEPLFHAVADRWRHLDDWEPAQYVQLAWAFAVLDVPSPIFGPHSEFCSVPERVHTHKRLCQLHQVELWRREHTTGARAHMLAATNPTGRAETTTNPRDSTETTTYPTGSAATTTNPTGTNHTGSAGTTTNPTGSSEELEYWLELPPHVLEECSRSFERIESQPSNFQRAVGSALSDLSLTFEAEVVAPEGYSIDFVIESAGRPVAIEVDGPIHYLGTSKLPRGATVLKRRQLEAFGWRVVSLPYWEWQEFVYLKNTEKRRRKRRDLLRRRLDEALGEASSRALALLMSFPIVLSKRMHLVRCSLHAHHADA